MAKHAYAWSRRPGWWLRNPRFLAFQLREIGGVVSALYGLILLGMIIQLNSGEAAYSAFIDALRTPPILYLNLILFAFVMWHSISWFMLTGKMQRIRVGEARVSWKIIFGANILLWLGVSAVVVYLIFGGI